MMPLRAVQLLRPLTGLRVGISISESDESEQLGFPSWQVNRATVQVASALLGQGAGVVFGHDWRDDGVMQAVHAFAQQMQPVAGGASGDHGEDALLENLLPWGEAPSLSDEQQARLAATLRVEVVHLPPDLDELLRRRPLDWITPTSKRYLRARALTQLRRVLDARTNARVCLGGRTSGFAGRYPGVIEEASFALESGHPLYLTGLLGGATQLLIDAITGDDDWSSFDAGVVGEEESPIDEVYARMSATGPARGLQATDDARVDYRRVGEMFRRNGVERIARSNGLSADENRLLFRAVALDTVIQLVLTGLSRLRSRDDDRRSRSLRER